MQQVERNISSKIYGKSSKIPFGKPRSVKRRAKQVIQMPLSINKTIFYENWISQLIERSEVNHLPTNNQFVS